MVAVHTTFVVGMSPRCPRLELKAFVITCTHQNLGQCITAGWGSEKSTKFAISVSPRCTRLELKAYVIISTHQYFGPSMHYSRSSLYVQKSCTSQETALSMIWLLECSSPVKCKTVRSHDRPHPTWLEGCVLCFEIGGIWCDPSEILGDPLEERR